MARKARCVCLGGEKVKLPTDQKGSEPFVDRIIDQASITGDKVIMWLPQLKGKKDKRVELRISQMREVAEYICGFYQIPIPANFARAS